MTNSKIICVLGPARSGTSLTTIILNRLGVFFGPEDHLPLPYINNPKGSWENKLITEVNTKIVLLMGGDWHQPPPFPPGWENASKFEELREQAKVMIQQEFADVETWGWKEPQTCLTLPFWLTLVQPTHYVICLRNPMDVARSLERRNGFPLEKGFYLWLFYIKFALKYTVDKHRFFVFSENWMNCWQDELQNLSRFIGGHKTTMQDNLKKDVQATIDKNLWNSSSIKSITKVLEIYQNLSKKEFIQSSALDETLQETLDVIAPEAKQREHWKKANAYYQWLEQLDIAIQEIAALIPVGKSFILVDEGQLGYDILGGRLAIPMMDRNGQFWGSPKDDQAAIQEFLRQQKSGANFIVIAWPAFWWLDYYSEFFDYLRSHFPCILKNDRLIVFDLRASVDT